MQVRKLIDSIEQILTVRGIKHAGREVLRSWMSEELSIITGDHEFNWSEVWLDPIIETEIGAREYDLPDNFPSNFASRGDGYVCILKDTVANSQNELEYRSPGRFYSIDLLGESNAQPTVYTITTTDTGSRKLVLSPPPDLASYTVSGLYRPTDWALSDQDSVPPIPNPYVLVYAVLRRFPTLVNEFAPQYQQSMAYLLLGDAKNHKMTISTNHSRYNRF